MRLLTLTFILAGASTVLGQEPRIALPVAPHVALPVAPYLALPTVEYVHWAPQDPADSLYKSARDNLNRGDYRKAADIFAQIPQRHPTSAYAPDSYYYRALSLYRVGGQNDLRSALTALDTLRDRYSTHRLNRGEGDAPALTTRILGSLAAQGDASARTRLAQAAQSGTQSCDREEMAVKIEALNAFSRMSPDSTAAIIRTVLSRRDVCSVSLRQSALLLSSKQPEAERLSLLSEVLKSDPSIDVRRDAVTQIGRIPSDRALTALEQIIMAPADSLLHSSAIRALRDQNPARARDVQRVIIESATFSERIKTEAINTLGQDTSATAASYLRAAYPRTASRTLRSRIITALARRPNAETVTFLMGIVRSTAEQMEFRRSAVAVANTAAVPIQDVATLYDGVTELDLRVQIITTLGTRREPEATDKLIAIAKTPGLAPELSRTAINALSRKDDPRTKALLLEIIRR